MFIRKNAADEIAEAVRKGLVGQTLQEIVRPLEKVNKAIDLLNEAAEIFDAVGFHKEAEYTTVLLEAFAAKKNNKKKKGKKSPPSSKSKSTKKSPAKKKKTDPAMKDLTSDKMVDNLKEKGWVFNADDDKHDHDCMCSKCMDVNDAADVVSVKKKNHGDDCPCMYCMDDVGGEHMETDDQSFEGAEKYMADDGDDFSLVDDNDASDYDYDNIPLNTIQRIDHTKDHRFDTDLGRMMKEMKDQQLGRDNEEDFEDDYHEMGRDAVEVKTKRDIDRIINDLSKTPREELTDPNYKSSRNSFKIQR